MSDTENKKLSELRVVDLRAELEKRGLDKNGVKKDLVERLQKALQSEGHDPETYSFKLGDKSSKRLSTSSSSCQGDDNVSEKAENESDKNKVASVETTTGGDNQTKVKSQLAEKESQDSETTENTTQATTNASVEETSSDVKHQETGDTTKAEPEPEAINLTLEEEEKINDETAEAEEASEEKTKVESDEKTSPKPVEGSKESTTSATPQQPAKKNEDGQQGANNSSGTNEELSPKKAQSNPRILWITNVPKNTRANELKQLLSACGKVVCAKVVVNARFPGSCCFGYVTMGTAEDATNVIAKLNNTEFNGQIIKIDKFENIKADNLKKSTEEKKEDRREDSKNKKGPDDKEKSEQGTKHDDKEKIRHSLERRKSRSERSSRSRRRTHSREPMREREHSFHRSESSGHHRASVLTFDKIKRERERQRERERERAAREDSRRRHEEAMRLREMREIARRQKNEAQRLEREREMLRIERDKIEREKSELLKLERERQKLEREKIEMEKMELQRSRMRLEEDRRAVKRPLPAAYRREESFDERKRSTNDRHYDEGSRFEPPPHSSHNPVSKKFPPTKDFKRLNYDKSDSFSDKRGRDYNADRNHPTNAQGSNYDRFNDMRGRNSREVASQSNSVTRGKDSRYPERDRSPHFRPMPDSRDRHVPSQIKSDREHHYSETNASGRYHPVAPQSKFSSSTPKPWTKQGGGTWRSDPPSGWVSTSASSGRPSMGQQFSGNSSLPPSVCSPPPPPGIGNFSSDRYSGIRKY